MKENSFSNAEHHAIRTIQPEPELHPTAEDDGISANKMTGDENQTMQSGPEPQEVPVAGSDADHMSFEQIIDADSESDAPGTEETDSVSEETENSLPLLGHLRELRKRIIRILIIIFIGFFALFGISEEIYSFVAEPLVRSLPEGSTMIYTKPHGAFFTYMKVSLMCSVIFTCPLTFYQLWAFIAPGLYKEEKKHLLPLAFFSAFFFLAGSAFCYLLVFPVAFGFFMGFGNDFIVPMISVEEYLSFALKLLFAFGVVFEMPLFSFFLSRMGLVTPDSMRKVRKFAILGIFIIAALLTPPDIFSQLLMALPMIILYEASIIVARLARRKKAVAVGNESDLGSVERNTNVE